MEVSPRLLGWARDRSKLHDEDLIRRSPKWSEWARGERQPTLKQLVGIAQATHTSMRYPFLREPPEEGFRSPTTER